MYVVVDALQAHMAQSGLAQMPAAKFNKLLGDLDAMEVFLKESR